MGAGTIPQCTVPNTSDEKRLMLKLVLKSMKWLQRYEEWVLKTAGQHIGIVH